MVTYYFRPDVRVIGEYPKRVSREKILRENPVEDATSKYIKNNGGPLSRLALSKIPDSFYDLADRLNSYVSIAVRVEEFLKGDEPKKGKNWHPDCHLSDFATPGIFYPPFRKELPKILFYTLSTDQAGVSNPIFMMNPFEYTGNIDIESTESKKKDQYDLLLEVRADIAKKINATDPKDVIQTLDGQLTMFDMRSIHRGTPARVDGNRFFFRASMLGRKPQYN